MKPMTRYPHVAAAVFDQPWLITPAAMRAIVEVMELRLDGGRLTEAEIADRLAVAGRTAGPRSGGRRAGAVAVLSVYGVLSHRANLMSEMSGGTSVQGLQRAFREALADPEVAGILLDVDSPGGAVSGIPEFGEEIRAARGQKPIVAVSNTLMASAAYWLGSQADELVLTPSSLTGSVGVVMAHQDWTGADEKIGVKTTLVHAGEHKVETYPETPLSDEARAYMQDLVDYTYEQFVTAVAKGRGVSAAHVRDRFGQGRVLDPKPAVAAGMADRVATFEDAVVRLAQGKVQPQSATDELERYAASLGARVELDGRSVLEASPSDESAAPEPESVALAAVALDVRASVDEAEQRRRRARRLRR